MKTRANCSHDLLNRRSKYLERNPGCPSTPARVKTHRLTQRVSRHPKIYRGERKSRQPPQQHDGARSLNHCHRILFTWCGRVGLFPFAGGLHFSGSKAEKDTPSANTPATSRTPLGRNDEDRRLWRPVTTTYALLLVLLLLLLSSCRTLSHHASGIVSYERGDICPVRLR